MAVKVELGQVDKFGRKHGFTRDCADADTAADVIAEFVRQTKRMGSRVGYVRIDGVPVDVEDLR